MNFDWFDLNPAAGVFSRESAKSLAWLYQLTDDIDYLLLLRENIAWSSDGLYVELGMQPGRVQPRFWAEAEG